MSAEPTERWTRRPRTYHGGRLIARRLKAHGVSQLFTLSGGHLFSIYDGCREEGIEIVDVRHESTAAFAAEGWAKVTREPGVCALTAGPGVTNGMSAMASAQANHSPIVVLGGRAPAMRWGQGSLQEIDHVPFVRPLTKLAATPARPRRSRAGRRRLRGCTRPPRRTGVRGLPARLRVHGGPGAGARRAPRLPEPVPAAEGAIERAAELLSRPNGRWSWPGPTSTGAAARQALAELVERLRIPTFLNGLARGCLPADHELFFSRARSKGLKEADVALVIGVPMDFRLGFGAAFGEDTEIVVLDAAEPERSLPRPVAAECYGALGPALSAIAAAAGGRSAGDGGLDLGAARGGEREAGLRARPSSRDERAPLHPMRIYAELDELLDRDAIVIGDGGDFVSYAGRLVNSYQPGCWLDPGPFGCLGTGPGYALAAKLARPERQVVLLLGDGAFGFSGMEFDTLARHGVNVVGVIGNNGIWALEKHPMEFLYGYSVAADLRPGTRYDEVVQALGGQGELVERPQELRRRLERALDRGRAGARERADRPLDRLPAALEPRPSRRAPAASNAPP